MDLKRELLSEDLMRDVTTKSLYVKGKSRRGMTFNKSAAVKDHEWLFLGDNGAFCIPCKLFCSGSSVPKRAGGLTSEPWTNYSKKKALESHGDITTCKYHHSAQTAATAFIKREIKCQVPNAAKQAAGLADDFKDVKEMVEAVSLSIVVAARQNIALRGHRNERLDRSNLSMISINGNKEKIIKGDKNAGNLNSLLRLCFTSGSQDLQHLKDKPSTFTSPKSQNEVIASMADYVREQIVKEIGDAPYSIIADETTDNATKEQLCLAVRYVSWEDDVPSIQERFLCFVNVVSLTGETKRLSSAATGEFLLLLWVCVVFIIILQTKMIWCYLLQCIVNNL